MPIFVTPIVILYLCPIGYNFSVNYRFSKIETSCQTFFSSEHKVVPQKKIQRDPFILVGSFTQ